LLLGNEYIGAKQRLIVLQNFGVLQKVAVTLKNSSAGADLQVYDCFGNKQPNASTLQVGREPLYVLAPANANLAIQLAESFGKDIAPAAKVLCDDPKAQDSASKLFNDTMEFDFHDEPERDGLLATESKLRLDVTLQWSTPQRISSALLYASLADNDKSSPLDYEVWARQNGNWKKVDAIAQNPLTEFLPVGTRIISSYDNPWIFLHRFPAPVAADALRFRFLRTTRGQYAGDELADALEPTLKQYLKQRVELRELQVFAN
jgi:hypothetical protein